MHLDFICELLSVFTCYTCLYVRVIMANRGSGVRWNLRSWHTISAGLIQEVGCERECVEYRCGRPAWTCPDLEKTLNNSREKEARTDKRQYMTASCGQHSWHHESILCSCTFKNSCCWIFYLRLLIIYLQVCFCVGMWLRTLTKSKHDFLRVWTCAECSMF